ncbi:MULTISPECIES: hypothetical protein [Limnospira]|uniref:Uncharacterized protein n=1 Tax=Limnospira fusiformis PMC 851.14 TaxID=2219512 RepID=A0ABU9EID4_LIMFS|nr:hypothetical protein [Limnospira maxima]QJB25761.1 hypothetical protein HFV01_08115 [Limnospira fusiformis SAG 85.79]
MKPNKESSRLGETENVGWVKPNKESSRVVGWVKPNRGQLTQRRLGETQQRE